MSDFVNPINRSLTISASGKSAIIISVRGFRSMGHFAVNISAFAQNPRRRLNTLEIIGCILVETLYSGSVARSKPEIKDLLK